MRTGDEKIYGTWGPLILAGAAAVLSFVGVVDLARYVAELGPRVGDVVSFTADPGTATDLYGLLDVVRTDLSPCRLDMTTMRRLGGSVIVEERQPGPPRIYRVHWSGTHSSRDLDCGASADLLLQDAAIETLAVAAGGFRVEHRRLIAASTSAPSSPGVQ